MATYVAILLGVALGGVTASFAGYGPWPMVLCVLSIAVIGWGCACLIPVAAPSDPTLRIDWRILRATRSLLSEAFASTETVILMITISWFWFLGATFLSLVPSYGKDLLHADERAVTLLNAAFTVGIGIGSLACETLSRRRIDLGLVPLAAFGMSLFAFDVFGLTIQISTGTLTAASFWSEASARHFFLDLVGIGACGALYIVPLNAALQARSPPAHRARMIGALNVLNALFMVGSAAITAGLLGGGLSIPQIFLTVAIANLTLLILTLRVMPEFRERLCAILGIDRLATRP